MFLDEQTATSAIPKRRKLTLWDVKAIANKVVKFRMNESQACYSLHINPKQWFDFKQRHKTQAQFDAIIETVKGAQIENCVQIITNHGDGIEYTAMNKQGEVVTLTKPGDWRAAAWIAERVLSPETFGQQQQPINATQINHFTSIGIDLEQLGNRVYAERKAKAIVVQSAKLLPEHGKE